MHSSKQQSFYSETTLLKYGCIINFKKCSFPLRDNSCFKGKKYFFIFMTIWKNKNEVLLSFCTQNGHGIAILWNLFSRAENTIVKI